MDIWIMNIILGVSLFFLVFLAWINWRILIVTEYIARTSSLFNKFLLEKFNIKDLDDV